MCICTQLSGFATFAIVPFPALRKLRVAFLPFPFLQHEWKLSSVSFSARICLIYSCLITLWLFSTIPYYILYSIEYKIALYSIGLGWLAKDSLSVILLSPWLTLTCKKLYIYITIYLGVLSATSKMCQCALWHCDRVLGHRPRTTLCLHHHPSNQHRPTHHRYCRIRHLHHYRQLI